MSARRLLVSLCLIAATACKTPRPPAPPPVAGPPAPAPLVDAPRRPGKPVILVAMPDAPPFRAVRGALIKEIKRDFDVVTSVVGAATTLTDFTAVMTRVRPACSVLMDASTVRLYRAYQAAHPAGHTPPPTVVIMSSSFDEAGAELQNASGVADEVPAVTALVNLRSVIDRPVNRVGVVYRPAFRSFLERQRTLAANEQFTMVPAEVPASPSPEDVRKALESLRAGGGIDALWVPNDNELLKGQSFLTGAWQPEIASLGVPVVVGSSTLVSADAHFGTLAVLPDLEALGVQAANLIFDIAESDWHADDHPVELPFSTVTVVNMRQLRQHFGLREGALDRIDKVIE